MSSYSCTLSLQALAADMADLPEPLARLVVTHHWDTEAALKQCQGLPLCVIHGQEVSAFVAESASAANAAI